MAKSKVFISYRREDTAGSAGRLHDHLCELLGDEQVFTDVDDIPLGLDFRKVIEEAIEQCQVVLVVIGKRYTTLKDPAGRPRILADNDFVHLEVRYSLEKGKRVIPVLVDKAVMPGLAEVPPTIEALCYLNAFELRHEKWREDVRELGRIVQAILAELDAAENGGMPLSAPPTGLHSYSIEELNAVYEQRAYEALLPKLREHFVPQNPNDPDGWILLGHTLEKLNRDTAAEEAYREALRLEPRSANALTGLGVIYRKKKDYQKASECYEKAIAIDSSYAGAYSSLSVIYIKSRDFLNAVRVAEKGYQLERTNPVNAANLSVAYHYAGDFKKRDELFEIAKQAGYPPTHVHAVERIFKGELTLFDD